MAGKVAKPGEGWWTLVPLCRFILASGSPQRRELLKQAGYAHEIVPPQVAEPPTAGFASAAAYTQHAAWLKAAEVAERLKVCGPAATTVDATVDDQSRGGAAGGEPASGKLILSADTVVAIGDEIVGKAVDRADARRILRRLSGTRHEVVTSLCLWKLPHDFWIGATERTRLRMRRLTGDEIETYLDSGDWQGKAGAYGVQHVGDRFMEAIQGSFSNVVGLPMELLERLLSEFPQLRT